MCGRFTLFPSRAILLREYGPDCDLSQWEEITPRYNITPGTGIPVIHEDRDLGTRLARILTWGLVPGWAKDPAIAYRLTNARAETAAEKPSFRAAMRYRRCLIPASGFYEWRREGGNPQPYLFQPAKRELLSFAGLWEYWQSPDGSEILSCTILTTKANSLMEPIHHRMPVILSPQHYSAWLNPRTEDPGGLLSLLHPCSPEILTCHPVTPRLNRSDEDDPDLLKPVSTPRQLDLF